MPGYAIDAVAQVHRRHFRSLGWGLGSFSSHACTSGKDTVECNRNVSRGAMVTLVKNSITPGRNGNWLVCPFARQSAIDKEESAHDIK